MPDKINLYGGIDPKDAGTLISVYTQDFVQGRNIGVRIIKLLPHEFEETTTNDRRQPQIVSVNEFIEFSAFYSMYEAKRIEAELRKISDRRQLIRISSIRALMKSAIRATVNEREFLDEDHGSRHTLPGVRKVLSKKSGASGERRGD